MKRRKFIATRITEFFNEENTQPLSEKEFYKKFIAIHKDIRSKGKSKESILKNGFKRGVNVNALPFYKGFENQTNIVSKAYNPKVGDFIWLLPKDGVDETPNGYVTKEGYVPNKEDGFYYLGDIVYNNYLRQFNNG